MVTRRGHRIFYILQSEYSLSSVLSAFSLTSIPKTFEELSKPNACPKLALLIIYCRIFLRAEGILTGNFFLSRADYVELAEAKMRDLAERCFKYRPEAEWPESLISPDNIHIIEMVVDGLPRLTQKFWLAARKYTLPSFEADGTMDMMERTKSYQLFRLHNGQHPTNDEVAIIARWTLEYDRYLHRYPDQPSASFRDNFSAPAVFGVVDSVLYQGTGVVRQGQPRQTVRSLARVYGRGLRLFYPDIKTVNPFEISVPPNAWAMGACSVNYAIKSVRGGPNDGDDFTAEHANQWLAAFCSRLAAWLSDAHREPVIAGKSGLFNGSLGARAAL
ncbi:hypothetical protein DENSPDRAFT_880152 [Dentipellis sp. KUC8613]|nr:hypothetical protein DENSPDRAFT_880152 [Dentipellis sp. KUC8613]